MFYDDEDIFMNYEYRVRNNLSTITTPSKKYMPLKLKSQKNNKLYIWDMSNKKLEVQACRALYL